MSTCAHCTPAWSPYPVSSWPWSSEMPQTPLLEHHLAQAASSLSAFSGSRGSHSPVMPCTSLKTTAGHRLLGHLRCSHQACLTASGATRMTQLSPVTNRHHVLSLGLAALSYLRPSAVHVIRLGQQDTEPGGPITVQRPFDAAVPTDMMENLT